jgi:hypothetical protein
MNAATAARQHAVVDTPLLWRWSAGLIVALPGFALLEHGWAHFAQQPLVPTWSMHLSVAATAVLAASTVLYVLHALAGLHRAAPWTTRLAALGAAALLAATALRWIESRWLLPHGLLDFSLALEAPALTTAAAVLAHLAIERHFGSRDSGALVMPVVLASLVLQAWLMRDVAQSLALAAVVDRHFGPLWHISGKAGVLASALLCVLCLPLLAPSLGGLAAHLAHLSRLRHARRWWRAAMLTGFAAFSFALICAAALALLPGPSEAALRRVVAAAAVWCNFVALFLVWRSPRWPRDVLAWWVVWSQVFALIGYAGLGWLDTRT